MALRRLHKALFGAVLTCLAVPVSASPWVEADDIYLRASIQTLADAGVIRGNVNSFPLMWSSIARDLRTMRVDSLSEHEQFAYLRVRAALHFAQQEHISTLRISATSDEARTQSFASVYREKGSLTAARTFQGEHTSARLQTSVRTGSADDQSFVFDGSYLATTLGNWALSLDQLPVWWGPGQETGLVMSTNARPVQAVRINRLVNEVPETPLLAWLGPWNATAFVGRTQRIGSLGDSRIYGARFTTRPLARWEFGASYTGQWGGRGYDSNFDNFWDVVLGRSTEQVGNQAFALDSRINFGSSIGLYGEIASRHRNFDEVAFIVGGDRSFNSANALRKLYIEYLDTPPLFYEDAREHAGYRRWGVSMGANLGHDVQALTMGYLHQFPDGRGWRMAARYMDLGGTNLVPVSLYSDRDDEAVRRIELEASYQHPLGNTLLKFNIQGYFDEAKDNSFKDNGLSVSAQWERRY